MSVMRKGVQGVDEQAAVQRKRKTFIRWFVIIWLIALLILPAYWFRDEILGRPEIGPEHIGVAEDEAKTAEPKPAKTRPTPAEDEAKTTQKSGSKSGAKPGAATLIAAEGSLAEQAKEIGSERKDLSEQDQKLAAKLEKAIEGGVGVTHLVVNDADTGQTIFSYQDGPVAPASLLKVMTSLYALETLGPEHTFTTKTTLAGMETLESDAAALTVTVIGDGDANLDDEAIKALAADSAAALDKELTEFAPHTAPAVHVRIDDSAFDGDGRNSNWNPLIYSGGNMTTIRPAAMYGGRESYGTQSERTGRDPNDVVTERFHRALATEIDKLGSPVQLAALPDGSQRVAKSPKGALELAEHASQPLAEVLKHALGHSDNQIIETLMRAALVKQGLTADQQTVADQIQRYVRGFATAESAEGVELADANGLAAVQNTVPTSVMARAMTTVHRAAQDPQNPRHEVARALVDALPVAGETGTLKDRFTGAKTKGKMRAKTGSLLHAATLSGVVNGQDGNYVFAITIDNALGHAEAARAKVDRIISELF